ncbi:MAG: hypothetical protein QM784_10070 [Polyangiaceae bacterium]
MKRRITAQFGVFFFWFFCRGNVGAMERRRSTRWCDGTTTFDALVRWNDDVRRVGAMERRRSTRWRAFARGCLETVW